MSSEAVAQWSPMPELEHREEKKGPVFHFSWQDPRLRDESLENFSKVLLENGVEYLRAVVGLDYDFARAIQVEFKKRPRHGAEGALVYISIDHLQEAMSRDSARHDLEQSLFIHELVHGLVDEEELPMMIEFAFMLEKGHADSRLRNLQKIFSEGRLAEKYQKGLLNIAEVLGYASLEEFFTSTPNLSAATLLKDKFATEIRKNFSKRN